MKPAFVFFLIFSVLGLVSAAYGYMSSSKITVSDYGWNPLNGGTLKGWVEEDSLWWFLGPGDHISYSIIQGDMYVDPATLLFNFTVYRATPPTNLQPPQIIGLVSSRSLTMSEWISSYNRTFSLPFNETGYYNVKLSMYTSSGGGCCPWVRMAVVWKNPTDTNWGNSLYSLSAFLFLVALSPYVWSLCRSIRGKELRASEPHPPTQPEALYKVATPPAPSPPPHSDWSQGRFLRTHRVAALVLTALLFLTVSEVYEQTYVQIHHLPVVSRDQAFRSIPYGQYYQEGSHDLNISGASWLFVSQWKNNTGSPFHLVYIYLFKLTENTSLLTQSTDLVFMDLQQELT